MSHREDNSRRGADVEDDFVSPLTMIRGVLEMLRDSGNISSAAARKFLNLALDDCDRLSESIDRLVEANPTAVKHSRRILDSSVSEADRATFVQRVTLLPVDRIVEVDFSDFAFASSEAVNAFHDVIDAVVEEAGGQWYFMVNFRNCRIEPEAWGAFALRGSRTNKKYSLGTVRYAVPVDAKKDLIEQGAGAGSSAMFRSRQAAIDYLRKERAAAQRT